MKCLPCAAAAALWPSLEGHLWVWLLITDSLCASATAGTPPAHHGNPPPGVKKKNQTRTIKTEQRSLPLTLKRLSVLSAKYPLKVQSTLDLL